MRIAVIGAGNGGQAISAYLASEGAEVRLYDYDPLKVKELRGCSFSNTCFPLNLMSLSSVLW